MEKIVPNDIELYGICAVYCQRKCPYGYLLVGREHINTSLNLAEGVTMKEQTDKQNTQEQKPLRPQSYRINIRACGAAPRL